MQTKTQHTTFRTLIIGIITTFSSLPVIAVDNVPTEYYANYEIQTELEKIQDIFIQLDAAKKSGKTDKLSSDLFTKLYSNFGVVFATFPQDYNFKVIYQQCLDGAETLAADNTSLNFQSFMSNCYTPLNKLISTINAQYTVKVSATKNPGSGPAPLTVTFNARGSKDPSNETIPTRNFFRYYRDTKGIFRTIGAGEVITYTFEESGNYVVHLTVRSSNRSKGILDGEMDLNVDVAPKAATIVVYANNKELDKTRPTKIWTQEAQKGVIFDGSLTKPNGERIIQKHLRTITSTDGFKRSREFDSAPRYINVPLNTNGEYKVKLTTIDNENNTVSETFSISVSDPVAIIKQTPNEGNTSTTFSFDSSASYSLTSRLKLYTWEIFDSNGSKIDTIQGKSIKKQFTKPGNYTIRLTLEDELGETNVDNKELYVESSTPVPQFTITPTNKRAQASEFHLDATSSVDLDVTNQNDALEYKREFSNPNVSKIISTTENNKKVIVQFNEIGQHTIKLTVTDMYGKSAVIEKPVNVNSILRPELIVSPNAITRGKNVGFSVQTNKPIINYQRSFWDGITNSNQSNQMQHIYKQIWVYNVTVQVFDASGNSNSVTEKVFIGETGFPIAAFRVKNSNGFFLQTTESCSVEENGTATTYAAYTIDRYQNITIDPSISVNSKGMSAGLKFYFQPKYESVYQQSSFSYKFNEIGCQYIDLTVNDTELGKQDYSRIRFKVQNALPTLKNITLSFPQYGNETGIGFQENKVQNVLDPGNATTDGNLIVKVSAVGATDSDSPNGEVAYFKRYYYPKDNPNQILETRITPSNIPYTFFTLPRIAGEYMFGVTLYDSDDGYQKSEQIIGNGPTVFFPQTNNNPDIPIVTLKFDKQTVNVGDTVTFDVVAKVTSDNSDFIAHRTIQYDFDGDGERDLITTKDRATYTYTTPNERGYAPRAAVIYRGYKGISETKGNTLVVRNSVKPVLTFNSINNIVVFRDLSVGNILQRTICFDAAECAAGNKSYQKIHIAPNTSSMTVLINTPITQNRVFLQKYPIYGPHTIHIALKSSQGENVSGTYTITTSNNASNGRITSGVHLITIPEASFANKDPGIYVSKTMENSVLFYLAYEGQGRCFVDTDISQDSDKDGKPDNDEDIKCNTLQLQTYQPQFETIVGRIYFENNGRLVFKNFSVDFEGFDVVMDQNNLLIYQDITTLFNGIQDRNVGNADLKVLLLTLKQNLLDKNQTTNNIVQLKDHLANAVIYLDTEQNALLESIISHLENADTISAMGWNDYEKAREEILVALPENLRRDISTKFAEFELSAENLGSEAKRTKLNEILGIIANNAKAYDIPTEDLDGFYLPQFCEIFGYYELVSDKCTTNPTVITSEIPITQWEKSTGGRTLPIRLKVIIRIIVGSILIMGGVVVFFAVKAKLKANSEAEEETEEE